MDGNNKITKHINANRVLVLYHYFYPDDVVSARHYEDFCIELVARGWNVEVQPCNRGCRNEQNTYPIRSEHKDVKIRRIWRPRFKQASFTGRLLNAFWMTTAWSRVIFASGDKFPDVIVVGTDPIFGVLAASIIKWFKPRSIIVHWCYDLHPDASIADGTVRGSSWIVRFIKTWLRASYSSCSLIADIGSCMRNKLNEYNHKCSKQTTIVPWSLYEPTEVEPVNQDIRKDLFGDATLAILYSGSFGKAHTCNEFIALAENLKNDNVSFCFAARGNCEDILRKALDRASVPIKKTAFVPEKDLSIHLGAADIHLVSLKPAWTGIVVPSKFFGSLAVGRPVIFAGAEDAAIAGWIHEHKIGWVLTQDNIAEIAARLRAFKSSPELLEEMNERCHSVYNTYFSKTISMNRWNSELRSLLLI